jgi:hypothetical protein
MLDQASRKRRAIEDGPWMFGKDLIVVVEFWEEKIEGHQIRAHSHLPERVGYATIGKTGS